MPKFSRLTVLLIILLIAIGLGASWTIGFLSGQSSENLKLTEQIKHQQPTATLFFAGDIMLSRNVGSRIVATNDVNWPYKDVQTEIKSADISFGNLESPFNNTGPRVTEGLVFKAEPNTVAGLANAGFDILSTANNHAFDQEKAGVEYTLSHLAQNKILSLGTGNDCHAGRIISKNGMKFGFLGYSYTAHNDGGKVPESLVCDWHDSEQVAIDIQQLKPQVDYLILSAHMGTEYHRTPDDADIVRVHAGLDAGADMFVGHHPHWIQTTEIYKGKPVFYSLGNFVFDQMFSQDTKEGLTLSVTFQNKELKKITLKPVIIDDYCCPHFANAQDSAAILQKIGLTNNIITVKN